MLFYCSSLPFPKNTNTKKKNMSDSRNWCKKEKIMRNTGRRR